MKKALALCLTALFLFASIPAFTVSAAGSYTVEVSDHVGISDIDMTVTGSAADFKDVTVPADNGVVCTLSFAVTVTWDTPVKTYHTFVNGAQDDSILKFNYTAPTDTSTVFLTLPEGSYESVLLRGTDENGNEMDVVKYTNLTVTPAVGGADDTGVPVEYTPVWQLTANDLSAPSSTNRCSVTLNENGYASYACTDAGDPYGHYIAGAATRVGRYLLIKYNNHTAVPRMQFYIAQEAGIKSDVNMLEFDIASNNSGWTYVVVDLAANPCFDKENQSVNYMRFDVLEARNVNGGAYKFNGSEVIDVAYVKGFTTMAGLQGWLNEYELHPVHKTAVLDKSRLTKTDAGMTFTDEKGEVHVCTENADGTWGYAFDTLDVRTPVRAVPVTLFDGSRLKGEGLNNMTASFDLNKGYATLSSTAADPFYLLSAGEVQAARYMAVRYRTERQGDQMDFFMSSVNAVPLPGDSLRFDVIGDGAWHTRIVDLAASGIATLDTETWLLSYLRMDFFVHATNDGVMDVDFVAFFDSEDAAVQYEHIFKTYTATFVANNAVVEKVVFEAGATVIPEPAVPQKEGYNGAWATYNVEDKNFTVKAVYTVIEVPTEPVTESPTEPATQPAVTEPDATEPAATEPETASETTPDTVGDETAAPAGDDTAAGEGTDTGAAESGCKSAVGLSAAVLLLAAAAAFVRRKH